MQELLLKKVLLSHWILKRLVLQGSVEEYTAISFNNRQWLVMIGHGFCASLADDCGDFINNMGRCVVMLRLLRNI